MRHHGQADSYLETVGAWHADAIRNLTGTVGTAQESFRSSVSGMFYVQDSGGYGNNWGGIRIACNAARIVPTASENRVRTYGVLPCVYVGTPT